MVGVCVCEVGGGGGGVPVACTVCIGDNSSCHFRFACIVPGCIKTTILRLCCQYIWSGCVKWYAFSMHMAGKLEVVLVWRREVVPVSVWNQRPAEEAGGGVPQAAPRGGGSRQRGEETSLHSWILATRTTQVSGHIYSFSTEHFSQGSQSTSVSRRW